MNHKIDIYIKAGDVLSPWTYAASTNQAATCKKAAAKYAAAYKLPPFRVKAAFAR